LARCIKAIPHDTKNEFIIGLNNQSSAFLTIAEYDDINNKIKLFDLLNFEKEIENNRNITNVIDIYNIRHNLMLIQLYEDQSKKHVLTSLNIEREENGSINLDREKVKIEFLDYQDDNFFE